MEQKRDKIGSVKIAQHPTPARGETPAIMMVNPQKKVH
jgi:hypothetical protein